jgi:hypothetical protein
MTTTVSLAAIETLSRNTEQGAWVNTIPNLPGVRLKVRGRHNSDYSRRHLELMTTMNPEGKDDPAIDEQIETILLAETIFLDWNIDAPKDLDSLKTTLDDKRYVALRRGVIFASNVVATMGVEGDAKN